MTTLLTGSLLVVLHLLGCERTVLLPDSGLPLVESCISTSAQRVDFGVTSVGDAPVERVLTLVNTCEGEDIGVDWVVASRPFEADAPLEVLIPPGGETPLRLRFQPRDEGEFNGSLTVVTTDSALPALSLPLAGVAMRSRLDLEPGSWDAGEPLIGCPSTRELVLVSGGSAPLVVESMELLTDSSEFSLELRTHENGSLPWVLAPEDSKLVVAHYKPVDTFEDEAFIMVESSDPGRDTAVVTLRGAGTLYQPRHERFEVTGPAAVDVVFTVDRSPSMASDLDRLLHAMPAFLEEMSAADPTLDWHLAAVVADDGCVLSDPPYLDETSDPGDAMAAWATMVDRGQLLDGSSTHWESGFVLALAALDQDGATGCNPGLLLDSAAPLHIVHLSDDAEQSDWPYTYYLSQLYDHRDTDDLVEVHAIVGDSPSGCGDAEAGHGYHQAVAATGGQLTSICTPDLEEPMRTLAQRIQGRPQSLPLSWEPVVVESILVQTDAGEYLPPWHYDHASNSITFEDVLPAAGTVVRVSYHEMPGDCPQ